MAAFIRAHRSLTWLILAFVVTGLAIALPGGEPGGEADPPLILGPLAAPMIRAGLDAEALAAAGLSAQDAADVVEDVDTALSGEATDLEAADADYATARGEVDSLRRLVKAGKATSQEVTDLGSAKLDLEAAEAARAAALDEIFDAGSSGLTAGQIATLQQIRENRADWDFGLPLQYLVVERTQAEWVSLRDAYSDKRVSDKEGSVQDQACASLLATCDSDTPVSTAKVCLDSNAAAVLSAWETALAE